jgi:hypothetical protein
MVALPLSSGYVALAALTRVADTTGGGVLAGGGKVTPPRFEFKILLTRLAALVPGWLSPELHSTVVA